MAVVVSDKAWTEVCLSFQNERTQTREVLQWEKDIKLLGQKLTCDLGQAW